MDTEHTLRAYLSDGEWRTWREITYDTGITRDDVRNTKLWEELIGHSQLGIKLVEHATADELDHAINSLRSRAAECWARAEVLRQHA